MSSDSTSPDAFPRPVHVHGPNSAFPHALPRATPRAPVAPRLIRPHGGALVNLWAAPDEAQRIARDAERLPRIVLDHRQVSDFELLATGAFSPLRGFLDRDDFESVLERSRLADDTVWTIPVVLSVGSADAARIGASDRVALHDAEGLIGVIDVDEVYPHDKDAHAQAVYGTRELAHPGVAKVFETGDWLIGGRVTAVRRPQNVEFPQYHHDPAQTRALIESKGWRTVVGFQTRNPIHRAHEFILKSALEIFDGLLIQPLVGETRSADVPAAVRLRCYEVLLEGYYPKERTLLAVLPAVMRFAGPREAVFHALIRKNHGATHFIVGRDHAGVGNYYGPYDAQRYFDEFEPEEIGIHPLRFENTFYCHACQGMASFKTCPHPTDRHLSLSGTRVREMLSRAEEPPVEFTRPEVARVLMELHAPAAGGASAAASDSALSLPAAV